MSRSGLSRAERRLVLLSASTAKRREELCDLAAQLSLDVEWDRLARVLRGRRLLTPLGPRICELGRDRVGEGFAAEVEQALLAARRHGQFLQLVSEQLTVALAQAGIRSAQLKGPAMSERLYGDAGRRLSSDIDLLVAPDQLYQAAEVARGMGYGSPRDYLWRDGMPLLHLSLEHDRGELPAVELHWRIHWYEDRFAQERLLPPVGKADDWYPAPADELSALLLFYTRDGFVDLRLATDLSAWWDRFGPQLSPQAMEELLGSFPALRRAIRAGATAAEQVVGLPAREIIGGVSRLDLRDRIAARLANPNPHASPAQLYADMGLIDGFLSPPKGLREFVRRKIILPRGALDELDRLAPKRRSRSSLARGIGVLGRYALTLSRLLRPPESLPRTD